MTFVSIILAILIERLYLDVERYRSMKPLQDLLNWLRDRISGSPFLDGWPGAMALLVPPMLIVGVVIDILDGDGFWTGLLSILFSAAVLVWCFSAQPAGRATERFLERYDMGDEDGARAAAGELLETALPEDGRRWPGLFMTGLFVQSVSRLFGPLFWFLVLGPVGAISFRTLEVLREQVEREAPESGLADGVETIYALMSWIPTRLQALAFALVGGFEETMQAWRASDVRCRDRMQSTDQALSVCTGYGALGLVPDWMHGEDDPPLDTRSLRAAYGLIQRSVVVWVVGLALLTVLFGAF